MSIKFIGAVELKEKLDKGDKIILVDCREENEWKEGHISQAKLYPLSNFSLFMDEMKDKDAEIIIHCKMGGRSMKALLLLQEQGYGNLTNLEGGISGWVEHGYPVSR
ncbi:MAG: rhodanese-like domain-containing protein [Halobacteriovoraceae bacterium]|nr:rhodanese-like domain-containing protein [Halobacteriovoraceae bacterium]